MLEVLVEVVAAERDRRARHGVPAEVSVHLLRPVADVRVHVGPERKVRQPVLKVRLVDADVRRALAEADDEDGASCGTRAGPCVAFVEAAHELTCVVPGGAGAAPHRRGELVHCPCVPGGHVEAGLRHPPPHLDPGRVPGGGVVRDPSVPGRPVELGQRVEVLAEGADPGCLAWPQVRLVPDDRRDGDVVIAARRRRGRELCCQPEPVGRSVEDASQRPALRLGAFVARPAHEGPPEGFGYLRLESRGRRESQRVARSRRS